MEKITELIHFVKTEQKTNCRSFLYHQQYLLLNNVRIANDHKIQNGIMQN